MADAPAQKGSSHRAEAKRRADKARGKTRVNLGSAFARFRALRGRLRITSDAEMAVMLLDRFMRSELQKRECAVALRRINSSTEDRDSGGGELLRPPGEDGGPSAPSLQSEHRKVRRSGGGAGSSQSEAGAAAAKKTEDHGGSLVVGDGLHLVDLGSPVEVVVDEECLLQLLQACLGCHRHCSIRKQAKGLKLVLDQECGHCGGGARWTNLPDGQVDGRRSTGLPLLDQSGCPLLSQSEPQERSGSAQREGT